MIYLDYAAATPIDKRVLKLMEPYLKSEFGNPSSIHRYGQSTRKAIDEARGICMKILGAAKPSEVIFTGSGTEANNMVISAQRAALAARSEAERHCVSRGGTTAPHIIISAIEHPSILEPARYLRDNFGFELTEILPNKDGIISPESVALALKPETILVSVMYANNEIGTIQPIKKIAKICREFSEKNGRKIIFHTDACQAPGFLDINAEHLGVDLMTLNSSKVYGPKGVGLLYIREGVKIVPHIFGGGQEFRMRGGTENPALIYGFAKALEFALKNSKKEAARIKKLRDKLLNELLKMPKISLNGSLEERLPNNINVNVDGKSSETMVMRLDIEGLAASGGSACSSGKTEASHVLEALAKVRGLSNEAASAFGSGGLRLTLGHPTTSQEITKAIKILTKVLQ